MRLRIDSFRINALTLSILASSAGIGLALACSGSDSTIFSSAEPGTERGPCRAASAATRCDTGLVCLSDLCVRPADGGGTTGGAGGSGATGGAGGKGATGGAGGSATTGGTSGGGTSGAAGQSTGGTGGATCGDLVCEPGECNTCSPDCGATCSSGCGDGNCDQGEDCMSCPADCQTGCGDGCCLINENCQSCPQDCVTRESCDPSACGNNQCNYGLSETCLNCADCFGLCDCGDMVCTPPETQANCPWDC